MRSFLAGVATTIVCGALALFVFGIAVTYPSKYKPLRARVPCSGHRGGTQANIRSDLRVG